MGSRRRWQQGAVITLLGLQLLGAASIAAASTSRSTPLIHSDRLEEHVHQLASELRCLVCQNQTIADSNAALAVQLREEVRQQLSQGRTDEEVRDFMSQRYGDFVLYRPSWNLLNLALWMAPLFFLSGGMALLVHHWKRRSETALLQDPAQPEPVDDEASP